MKLAAQLHPVPKLRICGATPSLLFRFHDVAYNQIRGQVYIIANCLFKENVAKFKYLATTLTNQNDMIKSRID
jgi:hypothetical protein